MAGGDAVVRSRVKESAKRRLRNRLDTLVPRGDPCVYGLRTAREDAVEYSPCMCSSCAIAHSVRSYQFVLGAGTYGGPMGTVQYCRSLLGEFPRVGASSEQGRFF